MKLEDLLELVDSHSLPVTATVRDLLRAVAHNDRALDQTDRVAQQVAATNRHQRKLGGGSFNV